MLESPNNVNFVSEAAKNIASALGSVTKSGTETFANGTGNGLLISGYVVTAISIVFKIIAGINISVAGVNAFFFSLPTADFAIMIGIGAALIASGGIVNVIQYYYSLKHNNRILDAAIEQQKIAQATISGAQNIPQHKI